MASELLSLSHSTAPKIRITSVAFSPCGHYIVSIDEAKQLYVWRWAEHKLIFSVTSEEGKFRDVCFLSDLDYLHFCSGSSDGLVCIWHLDTKATTCRIVQRLPNKSGAIALASSVCGTYLAVGHHGHYVQIWRRSPSLEKGIVQFEAGPTMKHSDSAREVCFSNPLKVANPAHKSSGELLDLYYVAACSDKGHIKIWGLHQKTGELLQSVALLAHRASTIASICFSADGQQLLYSVAGFIVFLHLAFINKKPDVIQMEATPGPLQTILGNRKSSLVAVDDEQPLCVCANDHGLFLWDRENSQIIPLGQCIAWNLCVYNPFSSSAAAASSSRKRDERLLCALALASGEVRVWDLTDWKVPEGVDTNKRKRVQRVHDTKEAQEKEYEDKRIRNLQSVQAKMLEKLKKKKDESKSNKRKPQDEDGENRSSSSKSTSRTNNNENKQDEEVQDGGIEEDDWSSSSSEADEGEGSDSGSSSSSNNDGEEENIGESAAKYIRKAPEEVEQDKAGSPSEPKWAVFFEAVVAQGGLTPQHIPTLTSKGFSKNEQEALVF